MTYPSTLGAFLHEVYPQSLAYAYENGKGDISLEDWDDADGKKPSPEEVLAWAPSPVPGVASMLGKREDVAKELITMLKAQALCAMVAYAGYTEATANTEGSDFILAHSPLISAYKDAGGNPKAGQALLQAIQSEGRAWLSVPMGAGGPPILALFQAALS